MLQRSASTSFGYFHISAQMYSLWKIFRDVWEQKTCPSLRAETTGAAIYARIYEQVYHAASVSGSNLMPKKENMELSKLQSMKLITTRLLLLDKSPIRDSGRTSSNVDDYQPRSMNRATNLPLPVLPDGFCVLRQTSSPMITYIDLICSFISTHHGALWHGRWCIRWYLFA